MIAHHHPLACKYLSGVVCKKWTTSPFDLGESLRTEASASGTQSPGLDGNDIH